MTAPIIVTAIFAKEDQARFDALRTAHFPPERNFLAAHLTMFHHLPPSIEAELAARLADEARAQPPVARTAGLLNLGGGTAIRIDAPDLMSLRARLAAAFAPLLVPQDEAGWRPHVTIQNKVGRDTALGLRQALGEAWDARPVSIAGLAMWWYRGGPWEPIRRFRFSPAGRSRRS